MSKFSMDECLLAQSRMPLERVRELRGNVPFRGVYQNADGKFAAQIKWSGRWHWLGLHDEAVSAARAYDDAATRLQGEFAVTNKMMGLYRRNEIKSLA